MALNKFRFTKPSIAGLTGDGASKAFFWDEGLPGFGLCVRSTGLRTWVVQFRTRDGRSHRKIGRASCRERVLRLV